MTQQTPSSPKNSQKRPFPDPATQQATGKLNQPQTRYPARPAATSDQTAYLANNATGRCTKDAKAAAKNTVVRRAGKQPTGSGNGNGQSDGRHGSIETQQAAVTGHWYDPAGRARDCDHCGASYQAKRSSSRFCSGRCRLRAHKARHNTN
jgi:hypothetical protein